MLNLRKSQTQMFSKRLVQIKYSQLIIEDLKLIENVNKIELKTSYLLNSYLMNLVAAWQTYIEGLLTETVNKVASQSNDTVKAILKFNLDQRIKKFGNPNVLNIDNSFEQLLGVKKITMQLQDFEKSRKRIDDIIDIRHNIAHKGFSSSPLTMKENFEHMHFLLNVAGQLETIAMSYTT